MYERHKYRANDPRNYHSQCNDCKRPKNATETDPGFKPDRTPRVRRTPDEAADQQRKSRAKYKTRVRRETRIRVFKYLAEKGCYRCRIRDPRVLEFDHLEPSEKSAKIADLLKSGYSWSSDVLRDEIRKCRVICANCHRLHTVVQLGYYADPAVAASLSDILEDIGVEP